MYSGYHIGGMHLFWWFFWVSVVFWIFFTPYSVPYQRKPKENALDILMKRYAEGQMTTDEYKERKNVLEEIKKK